jgi:tetratricopeptide (TPR) repeat protein
LPTFASLWPYLGEELLKHYDAYGDPIRLHLATASSRLAVECTADDSEELLSRLARHTRDLLKRFERFGEEMDIEHVVATLRRAIDATPVRRYKAGLYNELGTVLTSRFERLGKLADIEDSAAALRRAVDLTADSPNHDTYKLQSLHNLGISLTRRFERLTEIRDIEEATSILHRTVDLAPDTHPEKSNFLNSLGLALSDRFDRLGDLGDIQRSIATLSRAIDATPDGDPSKPLYIHNLGISLARRFEQQGNLVDLEECISKFHQAVHLLPKNHPKKPNYSTNLGISFLRRFELLDEGNDLSKAITATRVAVDLTPDRHIHKALYLSHLGISLKTRFDRGFGQPADLEEAIVCDHRAVDLTPDGHFHKPMYIANLANALVSQFQQSGALADLDGAVATHRQAVGLMPVGHPRFPVHLSTLASVLKRRFLRAGNVGDIEEAVDILRRAVGLTPDSHCHMSDLLRDLGRAWSARLPTSSSRIHFASAYDCFKAATENPSGRPQSKLDAALDAAKMCTDFPQLLQSPDVAVRAHGRVLAAIPPFIWLGQKVSHRFIQILRTKIGDAIRAAVSAAVAANQPNLALEWLEEGRNIVWSQLNRLRNPFENLREHYPQLADELAQASALLHTAGLRKIVPDDVTKLTFELPLQLETEARVHTGLALKVADLVERIRNLEGFGSFLRPKTFEELSPACRDGPVAAIVMHHSRCDALILCSPGHVVHIRLHEISIDDVEKMRSSFLHWMHGHGVRLRDESDRGLVAAGYSEDGMRRVLRLLWLRVVRPVYLSIKDEVRFFKANVANISEIRFPLAFALY